MVLTTRTPRAAFFWSKMSFRRHLKMGLHRGTARAAFFCQKSMKSAGYFRVLAHFLLKMVSWAASNSGVLPMSSPSNAEGDMQWLPGQVLEVPSYCMGTFQRPLQKCRQSVSNRACMRQFLRASESRPPGVVILHGVSSTQLGTSKICPGSHCK